jgi:hypothetical protein
MLTATQIATNQENTIALCKIIADCIKELGSVPSGHLYARLMHNFTLEEYETIINLIINTGFVRKESSHLLVWIGDPVIRQT